MADKKCFRDFIIDEIKEYSDIIKYVSKHLVYSTAYLKRHINDFPSNGEFDPIRYTFSHKDGEGQGWVMAHIVHSNGAYMFEINDSFIEDLQTYNIVYR